MGYLNSPGVDETFHNRNWSECFTSSGADCDFRDDDEDSVKRNKIIGMSVGGSLLLLALVGVMSGLMMYRRRDVVVHTVKTDLSPSHIIINRTENINEDLDTAASLQVRNILRFFIVYQFPSRMNMKGNTKNLRHLFRNTSTLGRPRLLPRLRRT